MDRNSPDGLHLLEHNNVNIGHHCRLPDWSSRVLHVLYRPPTRGGATGQLHFPEVFKNVFDS